MTWLAALLALMAQDTELQTQVIVPSHRQIVVVEFWADWCGPCHKIAPYIDAEMAKEPYVRRVKIDHDTHKELFHALGLVGLPAVQIYYDGALVVTAPLGIDPAKIGNFIESAVFKIETQ